MPVLTPADLQKIQSTMNTLSTASQLLLDTSQLLLQEMRKVDQHNVSVTAHMDLRTNLNLILPKWYDNGTYSGPVAVGQVPEQLPFYGIEFLEEPIENNP